MGSWHSKVSLLTRDYKKEQFEIIGEIDTKEKCWCDSAILKETVMRFVEEMDLTGLYSIYESIRGNQATPRHQFFILTYNIFFY